ncbi:hypothetical protein ACVGWD_09635, partial [Enterobacter asburiae]
MVNLNWVAEVCFLVGFCYFKGVFFLVWGGGVGQGELVVGWGYGGVGGGHDREYHEAQLCHRLSGHG